MNRLPIPSHFDPKKTGEIWQVPYGDRAAEAAGWAKQHGILPAAKDTTKVCLMAIDCQNTFCLPTGELFVGGRSGMGAVEDNVRLCEFIYRNLHVITEISPTMDTHQAMQIFHPIFWVNDSGESPSPMTMISLDDVDKGTWKVNPAIAHSVVGGNYVALQKYARHYVNYCWTGKESLCCLDNR